MSMAAKFSLIGTAILCTFLVSSDLQAIDSQGSTPVDGANSSEKAARRYPIPDEVYYVLSCTAINGDNSSALEKCSCAMQVLESHLTYSQYKDAEMVVALRQAGGRNAGIFRDTSPMTDIVKTFTEAQKAANSQCFGKAAASAREGAVAK